MSESHLSDPHPSSEAPTERPVPDHLPPVEPPSAGFIVQLFLVPAVIVAVVVGVYLLFGRLAAGETDWRQLVSDIKSDNTHVRWRAALNLAEALDAETMKKPEEQQLAASPEIAVALNDLTIDLLKSSARDEEHARQLQFVLKALGRMDAAAEVWPSLSQALDPRQDLEIRKQALQAIAMMAGRQRERQQVLDVPGLTEAVIDASTSSEPVLRQHAAYALGLIPGPASDARLSLLLEDADEPTRINAAIGFAREGSPRGLPVFSQSLKEARQWVAAPGADPNSGDQAFERQLILKNVLRAIDLLGPSLSPSDREDFRIQLAELEELLTDPGLRLLVKQSRIPLEKP